MMTNEAKCCEQGKDQLWFDAADGSWCCGTGMYDVNTDPIKFCPFCGHDLSRPAFASLEDALASLLTSEPRDIVFDVDGVLCDDRDPSVPYADRKPYPWVAATLTALRAAGHTIVVQTARYMKKFDGDQRRAAQYGGQELRWWLREHGIPFDEAYLGKASGHIYADDRGCRVASNGGTTGWLKSLFPLIATTECRPTSTAATTAGTSTRSSAA